ncbi:MAG: hypothetical protein H6Q89_562 [Myxococcaceae bacterium]|nr:hypothetical protein [Myxococcaceae bacterium]
MPTKIILRSRGQTIVLGVLTLLVLAVMMMLTFTLNQVVHEKIRIQSHSDAIAFSSAVIQARAFNSMVYSNRAIAAAVVAQMTVHAWMSTASATTATLFSGAIAFIMIALMELAQSFCPIVCFCAIHCVHFVQALIVMAKYFQKWNEYNNKVKGTEDKFNDAVNSIKEMVDDIHDSQKTVLDNAKSALGSVPDSLNNINAPRASVGGFSGQNQEAFACALEGSSLDDDCKDSNRTKSSESDRSKVMQNAANAMRPFYDQLLTITDQHEDFKSGSDFLKDIQQNEGSPIVFKIGSAYTGESKSMFSDNGVQSKNVGAWVLTTFFTSWHDGVGVMALPVWVFSDKDGGDHFPSWAHQGNHDKFKGVQQEDVCGDDMNCFINFRATDDKDKDFGQPSSYSSVKYDTMHEKMSGGGRDRNAWLVNDKGTLELDMGSGKATVSLIPRKPGIAISKAKTYFHQLGDWKAPPNFFDPFWRAKLHHFTSREEAKNAANTAGDSDGAQNADKMPIEGSEL